MVNGIKSKVYFIGIGGISMSAIARILKKEGHLVGGSDRVKSEITNKLEKEGIEVNFTHTAKNITDYDTIVYSGAISDCDIELKSAIESGKQVLSRAEALRLVCDEYKKVVCICGSHGKTTTTTMISEIITGSMASCCHIGGESVNYNDNLIISGTNKDIFITEACEYKDSFLSLKPDVVVLLNISADHLDYFKTEENLINSFKAFLNRVNPGGYVVANIDCGNVKKICDKLPKSINLITVSKANNSADYFLQSIEDRELNGFKFTINGFSETFELTIGGEHNLYNALACVIACDILETPLNKMKDRLKMFKGVKRRFEFCGNINGARVILDYAHHPEEIEKVIEQARKLTNGKVFVLFQPHTYSRTKALWPGFIKSLIKADRILLSPIYSAREKAINGVTSKRLSQDIRRLKRTCYYATTLAQHREYLSYFVLPEDVVLVLGAGDVVKFKDYV